jgi:hypothetical protein
LTKPTVDCWHGAYKEGWKSLCVEGAFAHPAKFSRALIRMIYDHAKAEGWVQPGCWILDPFGGVSLGAHDALLQGYNVLHCELEPRFHELAKQNLELWKQRYGHLSGYGSAVLLQGDSRHLREVLQGQAEVCVSSPPYATSNQNYADAWQYVDRSKGIETRTNRTGVNSHAAYGHAEGQLAQLPPGALPAVLQGQVEVCVSSPPFSSTTQVNTNPADMTAGKAVWKDGQDSAARVKQDYAAYGDPANLAQLPTGDLIISSPPYASTDTQPTHLGTGKGTRVTGQSADRNKGDYHYPQAEGSLGTLPAGEVGAVISSPPYSESLTYQRPGAGGEGNELMRQGYTVQEIAAMRKANDPRILDTRRNIGYSRSPENLGNLQPGSLDATISSPPYVGGGHHKGQMDSYGGIAGERTTGDFTKAQHGYGMTPGQLEALPVGEVSLAVSSPPYADGCTHTGGVDPQPQHVQGGAVRHVVYGESEGQLADAVVSSPPWDDGAPALAPERQRTSSSPKEHGGPGPQYQAMATLGEPDTFWSAAKQVLEGVFQVLRPGGHAIFVTKRYVRDGAIVEFSQDWARLCQAVGFEWLHHHKALLYEDHGAQENLFSEDGPDRRFTAPEGDDFSRPLTTTGRYTNTQSTDTHRTKRVSFFRRLHEKKRPDLAIEYEDVLCFRKPLAAAPMPPDEAWQQLELTVSSPPFHDSLSSGTGSDAFWQERERLHGSRCASARRKEADLGKSYGHTPGNLANLKEGDVTLCLSSPPYSSTPIAACEGNMSGKPGGRKASALTDVNGNIKAVGYGDTPGNLGAMPTGQVQCAIASPPYCHGLGKEHTYADEAKRAKDGHRPILREKGIADPFYGSDPAQLGNLPEGPKP